MQNLRTIKNRTRAIKDIARITGALEVVALTRLKRRQDACFNSRIYFEEIGDLLRDFTQNINFYSHPAFARRQDKKNACFVVIGSDKGLCGNFNYNIAEALKNKLSQSEGLNYRLAVFGRRLTRILKGESKKIIFEAEILDEQGLKDKIIRLRNDLLESFLGKKIDVLYLIYNQFRQQLLGRTNIIALLPLDLGPSQKDRLARDYIYQPEQSQILDCLIKEYLFIQIAHALLESRVSEEMARMVAMKQATENAQELVDKLNIDYHKLRQAGITKELLDIISAIRG